MYAIIKTGGKQYKVSPGDTLKVEKIEGKIGDTLVIEDVLMAVNGEKIEVGRPILQNAKVAGEIVCQAKGKKIIVFKAKKRKGYRKKIGHRQLLTELKIKEITI